jgi:hypothetical protein
VRGTNSRQTFYYWCYYVYQTHTLIWPTRQKIVVEVIVSTFKSRLSLPSEIDSFSFTLLLLFFSQSLTRLACWANPQFCRFYDPQPDYSAFREASYGHSILQLKNRTHAVYQWNRNDDGNPVPADTVMFHNQYWWVSYLRFFSRASIVFKCNVHLLLPLWAQFLPVWL